MKEKNDQAKSSRTTANMRILINTTVSVLKFYLGKL
jgi:hypothetical protein